MMKIDATTDEPPPGVVLGINPDKVCHVIAKARVFDAKEDVSDPDSGSNAADDGMTDVLEDLPDDATYQELIEFIRSLDEDEQINLVALAWLGRGTYDIGEWREALREARVPAQQTHGGISDRPAAPGRLSRRRLGAFGENCDAFDEGRM
jgi:hypothetical protein